MPTHNIKSPESPENLAPPARNATGGVQEAGAVGLSERRKRGRVPNPSGEACPEIPASENGDPEIITINLSAPTDQECFMARNAVLGGSFQESVACSELDPPGDQDRQEVDLLDRIWRMFSMNDRRKEELRGAKNPRICSGSHKGND